MKEIEKWNSRLEKFWFFIAIAATIGSLLIHVFSGFEISKNYYLITLMAWGIFLIRRGLRKRFEKNK
tara:strand:- start:924 stop:1124 length:201 start_codon:yes stop_codon:yes gene_type:complete